VTTDKRTARSPGSQAPRQVFRGSIRPLAHPPEPAYPCCIPALGEFGGVTPHEGSGEHNSPESEWRSTPARRVSYPTEDSPSGLGRTLGKRVGGNPSRVQISYPPRSTRPSTSGTAGRGLCRSQATAAVVAWRVTKPTGRPRSPACCRSASPRWRRRRLRRTPGTRTAGSSSCPSFRWSSGCPWPVGSCCRPCCWTR
jgi:hypothetical protein